MLDTFHSFPDYRSLLGEINRRYLVDATKIYLYRDMIGSVYFLEASDRNYVLKLFRRDDRESALQSVDVVRYLRAHDYPVVSIVPTHLGELYIMLDMPEGPRVGILYDFVEGTEPDFEVDMLAVGQQVGRLHNLMADYPQPLVKRGKRFFIDRYINLLKENAYHPDKISDLARYGSELWSRMEQLPAGFCHGDLHSGNMMKSANAYTLFDFDVASHAYPIIDVATLSDRTHFNRLKESAYDETRRMFDKFYEGYGRERVLSDLEAAAVFDFIAIRHYELNATVTHYRLPVEGRHWLGNGIFDQQYEWLMKWEQICTRKRF